MRYLVEIPLIQKKKYVYITKGNWKYVSAFDSNVWNTQKLGKYYYNTTKFTCIKNQVFHDFSYKKCQVLSVGFLPFCAFMDIAHISLISSNAVENCRYLEKVKCLRMLMASVWLLSVLQGVQVFCPFLVLVLKIPVIPFKCEAYLLGNLKSYEIIGKIQRICVYHTI